MNCGKEATRRDRPGSASLGKRDRAILDDVIRYRLITNAWVLRRYLSGAKPNAAVKLTGRLLRDGWLSGHPMMRRTRYFTAGVRLAKQRGLPLARTRPFGTQALATHLSVMRYCMGGNPGAATGDQLDLLRDRELLRPFPWAPDAVLRKPHVIGGEPDRPTWRMLRVDLGGRPDHVVRKCVGDLTPLAECPEFHSLLAEQRFVFVFLTASRHKKRTIEQALADRPWPPGIRFQIGLIAELAELIATS